MAFAPPAAATPPLSAVASAANVPRTPKSRPPIKRNTSASELFFQDICRCAGCKRADVPAISPRTLTVPAICSGTPLRHGCAVKSNCQRPGAVCSTLPFTCMNAKEVLSSPILKFARPSLISSFCRLYAGVARVLARGTTTPVCGEANAAGSQRSRFHRPSEACARIKLGRSSLSVPSSNRPRNRPSQRKPAESRSARRKYSWPNAGSSPTVTPYASSCGLGNKVAEYTRTSTARPKELSNCRVRKACTRAVRTSNETLTCMATDASRSAIPTFHHLRILFTWTKRCEVAPIDAAKFSQSPAQIDSRLLVASERCGACGSSGCAREDELTCQTHS